MEIEENTAKQMKEEEKIKKNTKHMRQQSLGKDWSKSTTILKESAFSDPNIRWEKTPKWWQLTIPTRQNTKDTPKINHAQAASWFLLCAL